MTEAERADYTAQLSAAAQAAAKRREVLCWTGWDGKRLRVMSVPIRKAAEDAQPPSDEPSSTRGIASAPPSRPPARKPTQERFL